MAVLTYIDQWLVFLKESHSAAGIPLVVGGLALMLFGWRMWKLCVMVSFGLIGAGVGSWLVGTREDQWFYMLGAGAVLGLASYWPVNYAVSLLGGLMGAGIVVHCLSSIGLSGPALWAVGTAALLAGTAFSYLNRQHVVIVVTAFLGAMLLLSGSAVWIMNMPGLWGTVRSLAGGSVIVIPFLLVVPTVVSSFYQCAEVRRSNVSL